MDSTIDSRIRDQIRRCSSCGFCQAHCPLFGLTRRAALNARGKMLVLGEILDGRADFTEDMIETLFQCTQCNHCAVNCPSGVEVPEIIRWARRKMVGCGVCHPAFSGMAKILQTHDNIYGETDFPDFERPRNQTAEIVYFLGCVGRYREEEAAAEVLTLLDRLEVDYTLVDEVCCGGVLPDIGHSLYDELAGENIRRIEATGARTVVTGCPKCMMTFNNHSKYEPLRERGISVLHLTQYLAGFSFGVTTGKAVTYHDPCDLGRHCGIYDAPRKIIAGVAPDFREMAESRERSDCCGAGGGVRGAYPANSIAMARRRLAAAEAVGAEVVLTECNSCIHNFRNAKLRKQKFQLFTIAQFLNRLLDDAASA